MVSDLPLGKPTLAGCFLCCNVLRIAIFNISMSPGQPTYTELFQWGFDFPVVSGCDQIHIFTTELVVLFSSACLSYQLISPLASIYLSFIYLVYPMGRACCVVNNGFWAVDATLGRSSYIIPPFCVKSCNMGISSLIQQHVNWSVFGVRLTIRSPFTFAAKNKSK